MEKLGWEKVNFWKGSLLPLEPQEVGVVKVEG
jgi:hypothetical protein